MRIQKIMCKYIYVCMCICLCDIMCICVYVFIHPGPSRGRLRHCVSNTANGTCPSIRHYMTSPVFVTYVFATSPLHDFASIRIRMILQVTNIHHFASIRNLLYDYSRLKKACVRQVALDKWLSLNRLGLSERRAPIVSRREQCNTTSDQKVTSNFRIEARLVHCRVRPR